MMLPPTANIAAPLRALARTQPNTLAIVVPRGRDRHGRPRHRQVTYRELDEESDCLARGLQSIGISRGARTVLMVPPSVDFFALTFALFKAGVIVVLIDPGMGVHNLGDCLEEAQPDAFIGVTKAHVARVLFGWARRTLRTCVTIGPRLGWGGLSLAELRRRGSTGKELTADADMREMAAILFTSGSTGPAKGVVYTHGIFTAQVEMLRELYDIRPGEVDLPTFPLFGLFGPALGMTAVLPRMDATRPAHVDPVKIIEDIQSYGVTNLFGSPALLRRVGRYGAARGVRLPTLRRVISAGAPVPWQTLDTFRRLLPNSVAIHTPYGATESLPVCSIDSDEVLSETRHATAAGKGVCVGLPVAGMQVKIIRIGDAPLPTWDEKQELPPGQIGEITVRGPVVTASYWGRPEATAQAKIADPILGGLWHRMGDVGYVDERGRVWFCGRKTQRVEAPEGALFTIPCEGIFNAHPAVARTALVGVSQGGTIEPVLCVELDRDAVPLPQGQVREELLALGAQHEITRGIRTILFHPGFPVDIRHNAKIFREKLAVWAVRRLS
jgi:acyl-CoA synthetase (AMP-forming)/AMP-acid ligase II